MDEPFRLSRIRTPRGTLATMILLAVVFLVFGLLVAGVPGSEAAEGRGVLEASGSSLANWPLGDSFHESPR